MENRRIFLWSWANQKRKKIIWLPSLAFPLQEYLLPEEFMSSYHIVFLEKLFHASIILNGNHYRQDKIMDNRIPNRTRGRDRRLIGAIQLSARLR